MWIDAQGNRQTWGTVALEGAKGIIIGAAVAGVVALIVTRLYGDAIVAWLQ